MLKKIITNAATWLPSGIQGNRSGASSKWVATCVQMMAESSMEQAEDFSIISMDLAKAYNLLARDLLRRSNQSFGTPDDVSNTYFSFLGQVRRSFLVYGTLSTHNPLPLACRRGAPWQCIICYSSIGLYLHTSRFARKNKGRSLSLVMRTIGSCFPPRHNPFMRRTNLHN